MKADFFAQRGFEISGLRHLSAREAIAAIAEGAVLLDLRDEFQTGMKTFKVEQTIFCPLEFLESNLDALPRGIPLITADATGLHSKEAALLLIREGFIAANLAGGIMDWERDGFPVSFDPKEQLSGQCPCMLKPIRKIKKS